MDPGLAQSRTGRRTGRDGGHGPAQEGQLEERLSQLWPLSTEQGPRCLFWLQREPLWGSHRGRICITLYNQVRRPAAYGPHPTLSWLNQ